MRQTKQEILKKLDEQGLTYDTALPQPFFDRVSESVEWHPWSGFVWGYPEGMMSGLPLALNDMALDWCVEEGVPCMDMEGKVWR